MVMIVAALVVAGFVGNPFHRATDGDGAGDQGTE
jgi:hypothetical protein